MTDLIWTYSGAVLALGVIVTGMTGKWRGRRSEFFSGPLVAALIGAMLATAGSLFGAGVRTGAVIAVGFGAWIALEALFALFKRSSTGERLFAGAVEPVAVKESDPVPEVPRGKPEVRRPVTPRGPQPVRKNRNRH